MWIRTVDGTLVNSDHLVSIKHLDRTRGFTGEKYILISNTNTTTTIAAAIKNGDNYLEVHDYE